MKKLLIIALSACLSWPALVPAQSLSATDFPKTLNQQGALLNVHHPVLDRWDQGYVEGWIPVEIRLDGDQRDWVGSVRAKARADVDFERRLVTLSRQQVLDLRFTDPTAPEQVLALARQAVSAQAQTILLDELLSMLADDFEAPGQATQSVKFQFKPPRVEVVSRPTQLLLIDGSPVQAGISGTGLDYLVNTDWDVFYHRPGSLWYVLNQGVWQTQSMLATGGWQATRELPADFTRLTAAGPWAKALDAIPAPPLSDEPPPFIISLEPTEIIVIDGEPRLGGIPGAGALREVVNTESPLFELDGSWYLLASGRWFRSGELDGPWSHVEELPEVFGLIPETHARAAVRSAVPGTLEARAALMEATLPRQKTVPVGAEPAQAVPYAGAPVFEAIDGTGLQRAVNTPFAVIKHNAFYYLCYEAAWYMSRSPQGPWRVATSVPDELFRIPPSDPLHHVTYVVPEQSATAAPGKAAFTYNAGYLGEYATSVSVVQGTGWFYPPWIGTVNGYPAWQGFPPSYGWGGRGHYPYAMHPAGYATRQTLLVESAPRGLGAEVDPAFQDPRLARRGVDYALPQGTPGTVLSADDDLYAGQDGRVYRREGEDWAEHTGDDWSTMGDLERQYGVESPRLQAPEGQQRQAYRQNPDDIARMERYYQQRAKNYNVRANIYVGH